MVPKDFYYFLISGFVLMLLPIGLIAWFQAGFFLKWLRVRASRGKLTLVKVRSKLRDFWAIGEIAGDFIVIGKKENRKRISMNDNPVYFCFGVSVVDMDESKNALSKTDYKAVTGFDAEKFEDLYTRALFRPTLEDNPNKMLIILFVILLAAVAISIFLSWNISQQISGLAAGAVTPVA